MASHKTEFSMRKFFIIVSVVLIALFALVISLVYRSTCNTSTDILSRMDSFDTRYFSYFSKNGIVRDLKFSVSQEQPVTIALYAKNLGGSVAFYIEGKEESKLIAEGRELTLNKRITLEEGEYTFMIDFRKAYVGAVIIGTENEVSQ